MSALQRALERAGIRMPGLEFTYFEQHESYPGTVGYWNHFIQVNLPGYGWANLRADLVRDWPEVAVADLRNIFGERFGYSPIFV
jgi:hypothetical protein